MRERLFEERERPRGGCWRNAFCEAFVITLPTGRAFYGRVYTVGGAVLKADRLIPSGETNALG